MVLTSYLLAIDGAIVGANDNVLVIAHFKTACTHTRSIGECFDDGFDVVALDLRIMSGVVACMNYLKAFRGCPQGAIGSCKIND